MSTLQVAGTGLDETEDGNDMRTIAVAVVIAALAMVILGLVIEAVAWLVAVGVVLLVIAVIAGWVAAHKTTSTARDDGSI